MTFVPKSVGRYTIYGEIAAGGMATVHLGRAQGHGNFARTVAIKRLHPQYAGDPDFVAMLLDEAWLAARIHHPNVVQTHDVVNEEGELFLVMDYVPGESLSRIWRTLREDGKVAPVPVTASIVAGMLHGLHAAHEAKDEAGQPLNIVHRDVSPQNVMVGTDGVARLLDFGVAKATVRMQSTHNGQVKGKLAYMAPEQLEAQDVSRLSDVYAASVVLWEGLTGQRLFEAASEGQLIAKVLHHTIEPPSAVAPAVPAALDAIVVRGLERDPQKRFQTAREMALALERAVEIARSSQVGEWVESVAAALLEKRNARIAELLGTGSRSTGSPSKAPSASVYPSSSSVGSRSSSAGVGSRSSSASVGSRSSSASVAARGSSPKSPSGFVGTAAAEARNATSRPPDAHGDSTGVRTVVEPSSSASSAFARAADLTPGTHSRGSASAPARRKRVLVIDDSEIVLNKVKHTLEEDGCEVIATTRTVGNARHLVGTDLVIIDYHMPGLDGGTVISSLRSAAESGGHTTLFYLYTRDDTVAKDYAKLGFDGCFTEKGDDRALVRQVRSAFRVIQMRALKKGP